MNLHIIFFTTLFFLNPNLYSMDVPDLREQLRRAVKDNQTEQALALIAAGAPVNLEPFKPTHYGMFGENDLKLSALQWAAKNGNEVCLHALLQAGALLSVEKIPLDAGISLSKGSEADEVVSYEKTVLIYAAEYGHAECVKELLAAKADVHEEDRRGNTALGLAVEGMHADCARELIAAKADIHYRRNIGADSLLMIAATNGDATCVHELIAAKAEVNYKGNYADSPLLKAAISGNVLCVRELIAAKADVNYVNYFTQYGNTPLVQAAYHGHKACVEELVAARARLTCRLLRVNSFGNMEAIYDSPTRSSAVCWAVRGKHQKISEFLIEGLLKVPNRTQKTSIIALFSLIKRKIPAIAQAVAYRDRDSFFKEPFREAMYVQNRNNFEDSIAAHEVVRLKELQRQGILQKYDPIVIDLQKKYGNKSNTPKSQKCTIQ